MTAPDPEGRGAARAMQEALKDARINREEVDYINAHGTATPANDAAETKAVKILFGEEARKIPISASKSMIGHCLGAAGALEAVATVLRSGQPVLPPFIMRPRPGLRPDYVPSQSRDAVKIALSILRFGETTQRWCSGNGKEIGMGEWEMREPESPRHALP
jgi:3-oxoacyl-[acyl-carrier-protein] synthase II